MRIILLKDMAGAGRAGEVKDVADGYALNLLIPRGFAKQATKDALAEHTKIQAEMAAKKESSEAKLRESIQNLHGARIELKARVTEKGGLFKTIGPKEIAAALKDQKGVSLPEDSIKPVEPVKAMGDHIIKISLPSLQAGALGTASEIMLKITAA